MIASTSVSTHFFKFLMFSFFSLYICLFIEQMCVLIARLLALNLVLRFKNTKINLKHTMPDTS